MPCKRCQWCTGGRALWKTNQQIPEIFCCLGYVMSQQQAKCILAYLNFKRTLILHAATQSFYRNQSQYTDTRPTSNSTDLIKPDIPQGSIQQRQKTVILTDSKAALQSLTFNTPDQQIHQLLKDLQLLPHECTVVLQWNPVHCGIPGNERADHLAKSGSKQLQPMSTSTYQEAKTLLQNRQKCQWKRATGDYNPSTDPINPLARHEQTAIFRLRTGHWPAGAPEANWHHGLCTLWLQRSRTDSPPHPPGLSYLAETETPVTAAGWVNHQQAVGNGGRPASHHPIPSNMWTEGLSTADRPQKEKKKNPANYLWHHWCQWGIQIGGRQEGTERKL